MPHYEALDNYERVLKLGFNEIVVTNIKQLFIMLRHNATRETDVMSI